MEEKLLTLNAVGYAYHTMQGETPALHNINFTVSRGEFVAIVGPSGCGKSTLLSLLCGLLKPESGSISFLCEGPRKMTQKRRTSHAASKRHASSADPRIGYMLQQDHLFEWRTIEQNVLLGPEIAGTLTPARRDAVERMLVTYGLHRFKDARPSQLSGGMRQRAALVRTLAMEPELLLLDEPFSALDYQTRLAVADDIGGIIKKERRTAILVTHDLAEAVSLGSRVIVLSARPATVKNIITIEFPDYLTPLQRRNESKFKDYFNGIWKEMNGHE